MIGGGGGGAGGVNGVCCTHVCAGRGVGGCMGQGLQSVRLHAGDATLMVGVRGAMLCAAKRNAFAVVLHTC